MPVNQRMALDPSPALGTLREARLVRDLSADRPHGLGEAELDRYATEIAYVESFRDSPAHRFERYRRTRTLVIGSGPVASALVGAALDTGIADLTRVVPGPRDDLAGLVGGHELVVHAAGGDELDRALELDRLCAARGIRCAQAVVVGDEAWIGPVTEPGRDELRWEHVRRRLRPGPDDARPSPFLTGPVPAIIATQTVFAAFEQVTGVADPDAPPQVVRLCLETLANESRPLPAHPLTGPAAAPRRADCYALIAALRAGPPVDDEELGRRAEAIVDDRVGVLGPVDERPFDRFPLRVATATVADPAGLLAGRPAPLAVVAGWDYAAVRNAARRRAIELYCSLMVDRRRLVDADGDPPAAGEGHAFGWSLVDGTVRTVPAAKVWPALVPGGAGEYRLPAGVASGPTWSAAVDAGLLAQCRKLSIQRAPEAEPKELDLAAVPLDPPASHLRELLELTGIAVTASDVTTLPGVPAVVLQTAGGPAWYGVGLSLAEALAEALLRTLLAYQARFTDAPYTDPAAAGFTGLPGPGPRRPALLRALASCGAIPYAVPLDHDPLVHGVLPYVARVALRRD